MWVWTYLGRFVVAGLSLMLVRSFAKHIAANTTLERMTIVEAGSFFSLLFLNNNFHFAHHRRPALLAGPACHLSSAPNGPAQRK